MSQIQRPTKQGGATTYQGKVGAGYTTILASEMDADLDTIYSAWNSGVDGSNIRPGVITGGMLAPGAVGSRELADGGVATIDLADAAVTTPKLADGAVTGGKLVAGGAMGGDLTGTYPNPSIGVIQSGVLYLGNGGRLYAQGGQETLALNEVGIPGSSATYPAWEVQLSIGQDSWAVYRAPPGSTSFVRLAFIDGTGKLNATLADQSLNRGSIAINSIYGGAGAAQNPVSFVLSAANVWTNYLTTNAFTTRGGFIQLYAAPSLSVTAVTTGGIVGSRWLRDATPIVENTWTLQTSAGTTIMPLPGVNWIDNGCAAGSHTYTYQVKIPTGATMTASGIVDGGILAYEVG